jgi:hypothetical protein
LEELSSRKKEVGRSDAVCCGSRERERERGGEGVAFGGPVEGVVFIKRVCNTREFDILI